MPSSSMSCTRLTVYTMSAIVIQIIGLSLFVMGFFPVKPALSGVSGLESFRSPSTRDLIEDGRDLPPDQLRSLYQKVSGVPPSFDRLILLVIDGLPAEFILGKSNQPPSRAMVDAMPYTHALLANRMAVGYHAKAAPPTVTMPRLKAMVSGAIGGFLDVAFNFNTQAFLDDNILGQFLTVGWKMVMLGDETWLKLFPRLFTRHDGVSSFFVKDTVQVDHNVSRHLSTELNRDDWNLLILHYLGLDHVGHIGGRSSELMLPKLKEMDDIIKNIHMSKAQPREYDQGRTLLLVVSDHGMTENGNHGGSSFEETDSLALFVSPDLNFFSYSSAIKSSTVYQVDIAPTLALLYGVPIPKNNVGVLISDVFDSLKDEQKIRALELNSWQLFRLLQAQLPDLSCGNSRSDGLSHSQGSGIDDHHGSAENMLCSLYCNAVVLHSSWESKNVGRSRSRDDFHSTITAYHDFLRTASEWLSRKATDKPVGLLAVGVAAMLLSCLMLLRLLFCLCDDCYLSEKLPPHSSIGLSRWHLDETFILLVILIVVLSTGSSSMVEEEQYIWHFVTSTFYLVLFRKSLQFLSKGIGSSSINPTKEQNRSHLKLSSALALVICGRILRGWHQGGVNWTHFPDISKWLEQVGSGYIKLSQLFSGILLIILSVSALSLLRIKRRFVIALGLIYLIPGLLVLEYLLKYQDYTSNYSDTSKLQKIYAVLGICSTGTLIASPWVFSARISKTRADRSILFKNNYLLMGLRSSTYVIGWAYVSCWSLLQLLLQKPINSIPVVLLYAQILICVHYFSSGVSSHKRWVQVATLYYLGMAGHFSLGNSNTLATIDVAGAFIGISSYSTLLSGIIMFMITYASPILVLFSLVMYISVNDTSDSVTANNVDCGHSLKMMISLPCLVPLGVNSILLTAYTILLLLMRNHLFVWSVFSPKYLYVVATTVCVYVGVSVVAITGFYTWMVFILRRKMQGSIVKGVKNR